MSAPFNGWAGVLAALEQVPADNDVTAAPASVTLSTDAELVDSLLAHAALEAGPARKDARRRQRLAALFCRYEPQLRRLAS